jgi:peptide-methionine (S)-S-oxide reductase
MPNEHATLGGGCFWCLEAVFQQLRGVSSVVSGYAGGEVENPTYKAVCSGTTGHAEVVQVGFDPDVVSYRDILGVFFAIHDPTTLNRQGNDVGTQYRSAIFTHDATQAATARDVMQQIEADGIFDKPLTTQVAPLETFYPAEDYHQDFFRQNPRQPYCMAVVAPKVAKFRKQFLDRLIPG